MAPPELVAEVLAALIEARDAPTPAAALAAYDRLGRSPRFLRWLAERDVLGVTAVGHPSVDAGLRDRPNPTRATWNRCLAHDGHRCRYCGLPVLTGATLAAQGLPFRGADPPLGPDGLRTLGTEQTKHVVHFALRAYLDHVEPWSAGGRTDESNLVVACLVCNCRIRGSATLESVGLAIQPAEHLPGWP